MSEVEELRQRRIRELQMMQQMRQGQLEEHLKAQEVEQQIKMIISQIMAPDAQQRLTNIRLARPEFARQIEILLIQLYQGGKLKRLTDEQFKALLAKIKNTKRESRIEFK